MTTLAHILVSPSRDKRFQSQSDKSSAISPRSDVALQQRCFLYYVVKKKVSFTKAFRITRLVARLARLRLLSYLEAIDFGD